MFRAYTAHLQEVYVVIVYMQSLVSSLWKSELSKIIVLKFVVGFIIPDGRIVFIQFYFDLFGWYICLAIIKTSKRDLRKSGWAG